MQLNETTYAVYWTLRENFHHSRFNYSDLILSGKKYRKVTPAFDFIHLEVCSKNLKVFLTDMPPTNRSNGEDRRSDGESSPISGIRQRKKAGSPGVIANGNSVRYTNVFNYHFSLK